MKAFTILALASSFSSAIPLAGRAPSNIVCNKSGWDSGRESFDSTAGYTYAECSKACFNTSKCRSFAYSFSYTNGGDCQLYDVAANQNFAADPNSPYVFYDVGCEKSLKVCGEEGLYAGKEWDVTAAADTYSLPATQKTASACYNWCKGDPNCKSFSWYDNSCLLYDVPLSGNFNKTYDGWTTFFFDLSCGDPATFSSPASVYAASKTTTTTAKTTSQSTALTKATTQTTSSAKTTSVSMMTAKSSVSATTKMSATTKTTITAAPSTTKMSTTTKPLNSTTATTHSL